MKNRQYEFLSEIYDDLMQNIDYKKWANYVMALVNQKGDEPLNILELGCGTGNVTLELLKLGYEVVGIDISEEMLEIAREKTFDFGNKIILIQQDISDLDFDVYEIDCVVACNDTFNYITDKNDLQKIFDYLYPRIKNGGQFVFDISSDYKLKNILGSNTFGESFDDMAYLWENFYDERTELLTMEINIFSKEKNLYNREIETHIQRAYSKSEIADMMSKSGFRNIDVYGDFKFENADDKSERIFFSCIK